MSEHALDDVPIISGNVSIPRDGTWTADLVLQAETNAFAAGQRVSLSLGGFLRSGAIVRAGAPYNQLRVRVVGGAGLLGTALTPRDYRNRPIAEVVRDALQDAGETPGTIAADEVLPHWQRFGEPAWTALARLRRRLPGLRVRPDGAWDAQPETWPKNPQVLIYGGEYPTEASVDVAPEAGDVQPGQTVTLAGADRRVDRVEYRIEPDRFRATLHLLQEGDADRLHAPLADYQLASGLRTDSVDVRALYPARVVQSGINEVDVLCDDQRVGSKVAVPVRVAVGNEIRLAPGTRVLLGWVAGDVSQPAIFDAWLGAGSLVDETRSFTGTLTLAGPRIRLTEGDRGIARLNDTADAGTLVLTAPATVSATYTPPGGAPAVYGVGVPIPLRARIDSASTVVTADA